MMSNSLHDPVLVVDDEADIRDLMEMTLMKMGLRVETAVSVEDAKSKLEERDYSLVLTDMRMPDDSGLEVVQYINELMLDTPVAVITAFGNADQAVEALKSGAFDYLQKPITLSQLRSLVKSAVKVNEPEEVVRAPAQVETATKPQAPTAINPMSSVTPLPSSRSAPTSSRKMGSIDKPMSVPSGLSSLRERFKSADSLSHHAPISNAVSVAPISELVGDPDLPRLLGQSPQMVKSAIWYVVWQTRM